MIDWLGKYQESMVAVGLGGWLKEKEEGICPGGQIMSLSLDDIFLDDDAGAATDNFENAVYRRKKGVCIANGNNPFFEQYVELRVFDLERAQGLYVARARLFGPDSDLRWFMVDEGAQIEQVQIPELEWQVVDAARNERYSAEQVIGELVRMAAAFSGYVAR